MTIIDLKNTAILELSSEYQLDPNNSKFADALDEVDELKDFRKEFIIPKKKTVCDQELSAEEGEQECLYLCSNSLGLQPKKARELILEELDVWATKGVLGHTSHQYERPWVSIDEHLIPYMSEVVGANPDEIAVMATLTSNLHFLLSAFYKPTSTRYKILIEEKAFPSDHYAVESQLKVKGVENKDGLLLIKPNPGEVTLDPASILDLIEKEGDSIAIILLPGVQYYTGQAFDMKAITEAGHLKGCLVGFDLAHAVGNLDLKLHEWNVDFACWCSYKYLSSGPGNIGGLFVHSNHSHNAQFPRLTGWWSHNPLTRFDMSNAMELISGASGFRHSNPSVLSCVCLLSSLQLYHSATMAKFRRKSLLLTSYLEFLLANNYILSSQIKVITPSDVTQRGCQLSLLVESNFDQVFKYLCDNGVVCDERKPNCIRVGPYPLVNTFKEIWQFTTILATAIELAQA